MKKLLAFALAVMMLASMVGVASAESTTTLTTTVPAATYTLNIPADQEIPYGTEEMSIGTLTVTKAVGFAEGKNLKVTLAYDAFTCEGVSTTIPFTVGAKYFRNADTNTKDIISGSSLVFAGMTDGTLHSPTNEMGQYTASLHSLYVSFASNDWGKALAGDYTAIITFTAEVVAG